jgi:hypothetical protein
MVVEKLAENVLHILTHPHMNLSKTTDTSGRLVAAGKPVILRPVSLLAIGKFGFSQIFFPTRTGPALLVAWKLPALPHHRPGRGMRPPVETTGIEPATSGLQSRRSPS